MADKLKKLRYANLCSDDCNFIINEKNLDKSLILLQLSDLHKRSREFIQRHMESEKKQRENRRQRHGQVYSNGKNLRKHMTNDFIFLLTKNCRPETVKEGANETTIKVVSQIVILQKEKSTPRQQKKNLDQC